MTQIIFFGSLSDHIDAPQQTLDLSDQTKTALEIFTELAKTHPQLIQVKESTPIKVAVNQTLKDWDALVTNGDELAFLPPVTGG